MSELAIRGEKLGKRYRIGRRQRYLALRDVLAQTAKAPLQLFRASAPKSSTNGDGHIWALKDASFEVRKGEVVGIIGRNGAGKSTLLKILARVTKPTEGFAKVHGRLGSLLEVGTGFHWELTGRENVYLSGAILGMKKREIARKFDEIVAFAEVEKFIDTPLKHYSTGMQMRLAFAIAAHLEPEILLVDEVLAVGDAAFQKKCLGKMGDAAHGGRTILIVSHQMNQIRRLCERVMWIDNGQVRECGSTSKVLGAYESAMSTSEAGGSRGSRSTSDRARFLSWEIVEPRENHPNFLSSMGQLAIKFVLEVYKPLRIAEHGISLYDSDRRLMWGTAIYGLDLNPGRQQFVYVLPTLPLRPGPYHWQLSLYDDFGLVDLWEGIPELFVSAAPVTHPRDEWTGILNIPADFCVSGLDNNDP
jgi:lipopolysaccharide transport system ATP-binding protein